MCCLRYSLFKKLPLRRLKTLVKIVSHNPYEIPIPLASFLMVILQLRNIITITLAEIVRDMHTSLNGRGVRPDEIREKYTNS